MPKLTILAVCEKVIIDLNTKVPSVIGIFQRMMVPVQNAPIPDKAVAAVKWAVFALWQHTEEEKFVEYTQQTQILDVTGATYVQVASHFKISDADDYQSKNVVEVFGLPIQLEGPIRVRVWLEGIDGAEGEYTFFVKHIRSTPNEQNPEDKQQPVN